MKKLLLTLSITFTLIGTATRIYATEDCDGYTSGEDCYNGVGSNGHNCVWVYSFKVPGKGHCHEQAPADVPYAGMN